MNRHPHILSASTNLLGICVGLITALSLTHSSEKTFSDEVAWLAALMFLISTLNSFLVMRKDGAQRWQGVTADIVFVVGVLLLILATVLVAFAMT